MDSQRVLQTNNPAICPTTMEPKKSALGVFQRFVRDFRRRDVKALLVAVLTIRAAERDVTEHGGRVAQVVTLVVARAVDEGSAAGDAGGVAEGYVGRIGDVEELAALVFAVEGLESIAGESGFVVVVVSVD
mmetsp:Transcript_53455/g.64443  ORF Transcript_53455/g.64443 Transcript_53455/m.64443 type:complete len:131 (-) Transcript_53455:3683-4075(-)